MKRYEPVVRFGSVTDKIIQVIPEMRERRDGKWVKWDDVEEERSKTRAKHIIDMQERFSDEFHNGCNCERIAEAIVYKREQATSWICPQHGYKRR